MVRDKGRKAELGKSNYGCYTNITRTSKLWWQDMVFICCCINFPSQLLKISLYSRSQMWNELHQGFATVLRIVCRHVALRSSTAPVDWIRLASPTGLISAFCDTALSFRIHKSHKTGWTDFCSSIQMQCLQESSHTWRFKSLWYPITVVSIYVSGKKWCLIISNEGKRDEARFLLSRRGGWWCKALSVCLSVCPIYVTGWEAEIYKYLIPKSNSILNLKTVLTLNLSFENVRTSQKVLNLLVECRFWY